MTTYDTSRRWGLDHEEALQLANSPLLDVTLATNEDISGQRRTLRIDLVEQYLKSDPNNMIILHGSKLNQFSHTVAFTPEMYVLRGASTDNLNLHNFYWGEMPCEDPNDACGGNLTAAEAMFNAIAHAHKGVQFGG